MRSLGCEVSVEVRRRLRKREGRELVRSSLAIRRSSSSSSFSSSMRVRETDVRRASGGRRGLLWSYTSPIASTASRLKS